MRIVFFGSPEFALPSLEALVAAGHDVVLAVSQPARPVGRSAEVADPPVARRARELAIPVFQPPTMKDEEAVARLAGAAADLFVVVAYGKILAQRVLDLPSHGCVNVHGSALPRWRGASPVQAALLAGDAETGVSIMRMEAGMDTGPVYAASRTPIGANEDAGTLSARLARDGAALLVATLPSIASREAEATSQDDVLATFCPKIRREDGRADFSRPAIELVRRLRAFTPWPGLFAFRGGRRVKLLAAREAEGRSGTAPGEVLAAGDEILLACGEGALLVTLLQAEGRKPLDARAFSRGERVVTGESWT
ncbi:MAG TPA: methionyl-tRNA formyltransferase [Thermoanaerobaculia bacterium]|nr:methionyl-tRNA formyltransferase [Thermoanaerobaculia bacterium]